MLYITGIYLIFFSLSPLRFLFFQFSFNFILISSLDFQLYILLHESLHLLIFVTIFYWAISEFHFIILLFSLYTSLSLLYTFHIIIIFHSVSHFHSFLYLLTDKISLTLSFYIFNLSASFFFHSILFSCHPFNLFS